MSNSDVQLNRLPVFDHHYGRPERWMGLRVDGLVAAPRTFSATDLEALAAASLTDDFRCEEGWVVANQRWEGVSLAELLQVVRPLLLARYAEVSAAAYSVAVPLFGSEEADAEELTPAHALLA
ncbi:MAG TPA: molybdopterin-dependent oxidoreductase, partial [Candidatus Entotheonella sp.]